jgi:hypothetical protein
VVQAGIDSDPVQLGVKRGGWRVVGEPLICLYEGVLCGVLGILRILQYIPAKGVYPVLVFMDKAFKYRCITVFEMRYDLFIIHLRRISTLALPGADHS